MEFRRATEDDAPRLAEVNRQLIEDEWDGGGMSLARLEERMRRWLTEGDYDAFLFHEDGADVAYSLISRDEDSAYVRHFFVFREHRGRGVGRRAMALLLGEVIPPHLRITLDVLASNTVGHRFWRSAGFTDYAIRMERRPPAQPGVDAAPPGADR